MNNSNESPIVSSNSNRDEMIGLVMRAREGSSDAFAELKNRYKPLLESQTVRHTLPDMTDQDVEDLRQEALVIFCNAICNYDCSVEGVEFGLYAKICIENGLVSFVRSYTHRKKNTALPLDSVKKAYGCENDILQSLVDEETVSDLVHIIRKQLSEYENRVWWLYISGMSVSEIAEKLGNTDAKSVSNAIYRIRKKLRSCIDDRQ